MTQRIRLELDRAKSLKKLIKTNGIQSLKIHHFHGRRQNRTRSNNYVSHCLAKNKIMVKQKVKVALPTVAIEIRLQSL